MKRKYLAVIVGVLFLAALVGAGTFAYFSDAESSLGNSFTAGTLNLAVGDESPNNSPDFTLANVKPGDSGAITYVLKNVGTIDGYLDIADVTVVNDGGVNTEPEGNTTGDLGAKVTVKASLDDETFYTGTLNGFANALYNLNKEIAAGGSSTLKIEWNVPSSVGNEIQGDIATVGMTFQLDQIAD
ncbi:MAG: TasA family protein [Thermacetogeniaceae bacterium]